MSSQGLHRNGNKEDMQSLIDTDKYFDFQSVRLRSFSNSNIQNLFLSLKSMGTRLSNQLDMNSASGPRDGEDFRANHTREDLEIESGIILKRYGKVLKIFLSENSAICFLCELGQELQSVSAQYQIMQTNLLRKYYPGSVQRITRKSQRLCKIMFYDLNKAIFKAKNAGQMPERESGSDETPTEDFYSKRVAPLSKSEIYSFRKFYVDWEEIKFDETKEYLFGYHTKRDYWNLFATYYRINQFNLIRPKLHVNEVTKIQKSKYDLMWKLRQKILRHLVAEKSESFVLKINVSKLCRYKPEKSHINEHIGEFMHRGLSNEILENIQQQSLLSMKPIEPFTTKTKVSPQLRLENLINNSLLFTSQKDGLSFKNSFFSNMMSMRENDSIGWLGFTKDANSSRRETSNRRDSYQMNKLGQTRQSLDLFTIQKKLHEMESVRDLGGEMKKQASAGNFEKKLGHEESIDVEAGGDYDSEYINLYQGSMDLEQIGKAGVVNQEHIKHIKLSKEKLDVDFQIYNKPLFIDDKPRKTFKIKTDGDLEIKNFFKETMGEGKVSGKSKPLVALQKISPLKSSFTELKEITTKQKTNPTPKLKDKLRNSKKTKKKMKKPTQFDNKEIRREMKKFELETKGKKVVYEGKPKIQKFQKFLKGDKKSGSASKGSTKKEKLKKSFKLGTGARGGLRSSTKKQEVEAKMINSEDEKEFDKKIQKGLLNRPEFRKSLKHIIDHDPKTKPMSNKVSTWTSETKQIGTLTSTHTKSIRAENPDNKKLINFLRSSSENLLKSDLQPKFVIQNPEVVPSENESKEIYTFGQQAQEEEVPRDYNLPSPKIKYKKKRLNTTPVDHLKKFDLKTIDKAPETQIKQKNFLEIQISPNNILCQTQPKKKHNVFSESFRSNQMSKGRSSQKDFSEMTPLGSPNGLYTMNFGQTFGDQPIPGDIFNELNHKKVTDNTNNDGRSSQTGKRDDNRNQPMANVKSGFKDGFLSQREVINKGMKTWTNKRKNQNNFVLPLITKTGQKKPKINVQKISTVRKNRTGKLRQGDSKNKSQSNSSGSARNMEPAWNDNTNFRNEHSPRLKPFSSSNMFPYQFKKTVSPRQDFFRKNKGFEKFQQIPSGSKRKNLFSKGSFQKNGTNDPYHRSKHRTNLSSSKKQNLYGKNPGDAKNKAKPLKNIKRLNSAQKMMKSRPKTGVYNSYRKMSNKFSKFPTKNFGDYFPTSKMGSKANENRFGMIKSQNNFMPKKFQVKKRDRTNPKLGSKNYKPLKKKTQTPRITSIQTERFMPKKDITSKKSQEVNLQNFGSEADNQRPQKSLKETIDGKGFSGMVKPLKKIAFKGTVRRKDLSLGKTGKLKQKKYFTYNNDSKEVSSSLYPNKPVAKRPKLMGIRPVNTSIAKPSMGSIKSLNNPSPMSKRSGYFMNSLNMRNSSQTKPSLSKMRTFLPKQLKGKTKLRKMQKKINARREYFDTQTNSFKTSSIGVPNSNKSLSIRKKIPKNRSRSNNLKPKVASLKKNYSKKNIKKPLLQRKPQTSKNLSTGHKVFSNYNLSQSQTKSPLLTNSKYFGRGNSLTSPFTQGSFKSSSKKDSLISNYRSPSNNNSIKKRETTKIFRDKSKVSSRAAATSRYTSREKNLNPASKPLLKTTEKKNSGLKQGRKLGGNRKGLRASYMKVEGDKKKKRKNNRTKFVSFTEMFKLGYKQN